MYKIEIWFNEDNFGYDVHSLVKSFYPNGEITMRAGEEETEPCDLLLQVIYETGKIVIHSSTEDDKKEYFVDVPEDTPRPQMKNYLKSLLYQCLCDLTGTTLSWGTLTGIRPTKIAMRLLEEGHSNVELAKILRERYQLSNEKTALCVTIANREREILREIDYEQGYSLYVGIPFCPSICLYCSFSSYPLERWKKEVDQYVKTLCYEIRQVAQLMGGRKLNTIYMGGGTPTTLSPRQMDKVLTTLEECYSYEDLKEFTVEAGRPDSITKEKLEVLLRHPVTRISVNPQTMNQETLDFIGRKHNVEDTIQAFEMARDLGFDNINMDLIVGLPGEDASKVEYTLAKVRELEPDSLTVHSLAVKRAARLKLFKEEHPITMENSQKIMDLVMKTARSMAMGPYYLYRQKNMAGNFENVGYSKEGKAGIYNILIMEEKQPIIALGAGGATKLVFDQGRRIERVENVKDVRNYMERIDEMIERKRVGIATWL